MSDLELDVQVIECLLELVEGDAVVEVDIKEPVGLPDEIELIRNFLPEQVEDFLELATLLFGVILGPRAGVHVRAHDVPHV